MPVTSITGLPRSGGSCSASPASGVVRGGPPQPGGGVAPVSHGGAPGGGATGGVGHGEPGGVGRGGGGVGSTPAPYPASAGAPGDTVGRARPRLTTRHPPGRAGHASTVTRGKRSSSSRLAGRDPVERRGVQPRSGGEAGVRGDVAEAHGAAPPVEQAGRARRGVEDPEVEGQHVAGFEVEGDDVCRIDERVDVGDQLEPVAGSGVGNGVGEAPGHEPPAPAVRPAHEAHAGGGRDGVERHPQADVGRAVDAVVRLVVVPRRGLVGARLLDQRVLVEEPRRSADEVGRQLPGAARRGRPAGTRRSAPS